MVFQAKEYLANPEAFAVAAAPAAETAAAAEAPKEDAKPAEEEAESDDDMVSCQINWVFCSVTQLIDNHRALDCSISWLLVLCIPAERKITTITTKLRYESESSLQSVNMTGSEMSYVLN